MNIGIFGVGSFGEKHINVLLDIKDFHIVGFFDPNQKRCAEIKKKYKLKSYSDATELIKECDAIDIVSSTETHYKLIELAMKHKKHIFVEKPICRTNWEKERLLEGSVIYPHVIQVGHIERYNPILRKKIFELKEIETIQSIRTGQLNNRNKHTPITLDLMIHDIDLILELMQSEIINITAEQESNHHHQRVCCKINFQNGKTANLLTERSDSINNSRKMTITCINKIVEIDLLKRIAKDIKKGHTKTWDSGEKNTNPLKEELLDFKKSIKQRKPPKVSVKASCNAVEIALKIEEIIN